MQAIYNDITDKLFPRHPAEDSLIRLFDKTNYHSLKEISQGDGLTTYELKIDGVHCEGDWVVISDIKLVGFFGHRFPLSHHFIFSGGTWLSMYAYLQHELITPRDNEAVIKVSQGKERTVMNRIQLN